MTTALIGYTGFVGSTLLRQTWFDRMYNRANVAELDGQRFDLVVCAAAPAEKWRANQAPEDDWRTVSTLVAHLNQMEAKRFVLISTVDVYPDSGGVDEDTTIDEGALQPYGKHRYTLERAVQNRFLEANVIRLPGLFGQGLKKNLIFDLVNERPVFVNPESTFQFYNLARLWDDLLVVLDRRLAIVNFPTEPVVAGRLAEECFGVVLDAPDAPTNTYDMRTKYAKAFGSAGPYLDTAASIIEQVKAFSKAERDRRSS